MLAKKFVGILANSRHRHSSAISWRALDVEHFRCLMGAILCSVPNFFESTRFKKDCRVLGSQPTPSQRGNFAISV